MGWSVVLRLREVQAMSQSFAEEPSAAVARANVARENARREEEFNQRWQAKDAAQQRRSAPWSRSSDPRIHCRSTLGSSVLSSWI
jgi:hypothetical protein